MDTDVFCLSPFWGDDKSVFGCMKNIYISLGANMMLLLFYLDIKVKNQMDFKLKLRKILHVWCLFKNLAKPALFLRLRPHFPMSAFLYGAGLEFTTELEFRYIWEAFMK